MIRKRTGNKSLLIGTGVFNELADAANWVRDHANRFGQAGSPLVPSQSWVWCQNQTGAAVVAGSLLGLGVPTVLASQNETSWQHQIAHKGVMPDATQHGIRFGVSLGGVPNGEFVPVLTAGVASVSIDVKSAHISSWAGRAKLVSGNSSRVESDPAGPIVVLWCASAASGQTTPQTAGVQKARILVPGQLAAAPASLPRLGQLTADMAYNATGSIPLLEGAVGAETVPGSPQTVTGHNLLCRKLWSGSRVSLAPHDVTGGSSSTLRITWSNSASRIRGTTTGTIAVGGSGNLTSIVPIDGAVGPVAPVPVHNVVLHYAIGSGITAWAEWTHETDRWEIYSADCAGT